MIEKKYQIIYISILLLFVGCKLLNDNDSGHTLPKDWSKIEGLKGGLVSTFHKNEDIIYAGKEAFGIVYSDDSLKNWIALNNGLDDLDHNDMPTLHRRTVRAFLENDGKLYIGVETSVGTGGYEGTDFEFVGGLYKYNNQDKKWEYLGFKELNINDMAVIDDKIIIGTQDGFRILEKVNNYWSEIVIGLEGYHLFNIGVIGDDFYVSSHWGLFKHNINGLNAINIRTGSISGLYINTVFALDEKLYVGTDNGVYISNDNGETWIEENDGIPYDRESMSINISSIAIVDSVLIAIYSLNTMRQDEFDYLSYRISTGIVYKHIDELSWNAVEFQGEFYGNGDFIKPYEIGVINNKILISIYKGSNIGSTNNEVWINSKILANY